MTRTFDQYAIPRSSDLDFDWSLLAGRALALEIGCGTGDHALNYALSHPEEFLVALERTTNKFSSFEKKIKIQTSPPKNLWAQQADAIHWAAQNFSKNSQVLQKVFILYPNPYPKKKQENQRFANMPFMGFLLEHLAHGGNLTLATNIESYYKEARQKFVTCWGLYLSEDRPLKAFEPPRTAFERKYLARGDTCYNLVFTKP